MAKRKDFKQTYKLRNRRTFSESFKKSKVHEIETWMKSALEGRQYHSPGPG